MSQNGKEVCFGNLLAKARGAVVCPIMCMAASSPLEYLAPNACNAPNTEYDTHPLDGGGRSSSEVEYMGDGDFNDFPMVYLQFFIV